MKKAITLAMLLLFAFSATSYGKETESTPLSPSAAPSVLLVFYDHNRAVWPTKEILPTDTPKNDRKIIMNATKGELAKYHFTVMESAPYSERLAQAGTDVASVERADLLNLYKDVACDYILLVELLNTRGGNFANDTLLGFVNLGYQGTAHVKLVDVKNNRYLYNATIAESTTWGSPKAPIRKIGGKIQAIIDQKLVPSPNSFVDPQPDTASAANATIAALPK